MFHREKREETFRRATEEDPSPEWTEARDDMCTDEQRYSHNTFNEYDMMYEYRYRPPQYIMFPVGSWSKTTQGTV